MNGQGMLALYLLFTILWVSTCTYAWLRGGWEGRIIAALLVLALLATPVAIRLAAPIASKGATLLLVDAMLLAGLVAVALRTDRYWPLWLVGLHLLSVCAEILALMEGRQLMHAYEAVQVFWTVPMQVVLAYGVLLDRRGEQRAREGADRERPGANPE